MECQRSSQNFLNSMNQSIDPCTDFYQFSCGNWNKTNPRPYWSTTISIYSQYHQKILQNINDYLTSNTSVIANKIEIPEVVQKAKDMFDACMDTDKLNELSFGPIVKYLKEFDLPVIPTTIFEANSPEGNDDLEKIGNFNWIKTIARMRKEFSMSFLLSFNVVPSFGDTSKTIIYLSYPEFKNNYRWPE